MLKRSGDGHVECNRRVADPWRLSEPERAQVGQEIEQLKAARSVGVLEYGLVVQAKRENPGETGNSRAR